MRNLPAEDTAYWLEPPEDYVKKVINPRGSLPLAATYTDEQVRRRIAFYRELNDKRERTPNDPHKSTWTMCLFGWNNTTTVRVYMRETAMKIAAELFHSGSSIEAENVYDRDDDGTIDREHGYVKLTVNAGIAEFEALGEYILPGMSYFVYDGEEDKYIPGNTRGSEFIIVKPDDPVQPERYWRRNWSFNSRIAVGESNE